jgi:GT2 family glycosyltransferase
LKTSVVILNWNGKHFLERFLPSVVEHSSLTDVEIIIADNASTDDSLAFLAAHYPNVKTIILDKNYGFAQGYNLALEQLDSEYYVLLNSDVEVTAHWIDPLITMMDADTQIAACMPKLRWYDNKQSFEYAGAAGGFIDKYGFPFCRGRIFATTELDNGQYDTISDIFWATGACLFVRADYYKLSGGLDADFFAHMEEIDLCWRLKGMGYRIVYNPQSVVYHVGGGTLPKENPFKTYLNFRNNLYLLCKNTIKGNLRMILFKRMLFDGIAAVKFLAGFEFGCFFAVLKAHMHFYKNFKMVMQKRKTNQMMFSQSTHKEMFNRSIVLSYFLKKKHTFNSLQF